MQIIKNEVNRCNSLRFKSSIITYLITVQSKIFKLVLIYTYYYLSNTIINELCIFKIKVETSP